MNIYENLRNKRKLVEKIRGGGWGVGGGGGGGGRMLTTLPKCQLLTILNYQICYQIKVEITHYNPIVWYTHSLICIFVNINENVRNKWKMLENLKGCMYNITHMSTANYSRLPKMVPNGS